MLQFTAPIWTIPEGVGEKKTPQVAPGRVKSRPSCHWQFQRQLWGCGHMSMGPKWNITFPLSASAHFRGPFFGGILQKWIKIKRLKRSVCVCVHDFDLSELQFFSITSLDVRTDTNHFICFPHIRRRIKKQYWNENYLCCWDFSVSYVWPFSAPKQIQA